MRILRGHFFKCFVCLICIFCTFSSYSQTGKDGAKVVSVANTIVNDYTGLIADASAGSVFISVASNTMNTVFASPLAAGDLLFIIQMQGGYMNWPDDSTYGDILGYQNAGNNEFAQVQSISGTTDIRLSCGLKNNYTATGHTQVLRVPRYSFLTINGGGVITCPLWNGAYGGVIAMEVVGSTTINAGGSIDASAKGFRGGLLLDNNTNWGVGNYRWSTNDYGAEKGEGIAGTAADYDGMGGRYCKGAPMNGGGGASAHNGGGGGGGNAGPNPWNGRGVPDLSTASWANAWNLEYSGFSASNSSGGGKGGYSFSSANLDALTVGPFNSTWGGDQRRENGGRGGRPLDYSTGRLFMGGGGGSGDQNNSAGGAGGAGGGLIYIYSYSDVSGGGQILANGANGASTVGSNGTDGAGGGGAGGTIIINATNGASAITLSANGGNGGNQSVPLFTLEAEGPGGGGGGGYIAISSGSPTRNANGGTNGTTNSYGMSEFPPNGATKGGIGLPTQGIGAFRINTSPVTTCYSTPTTLSFSTSGPVPSGISYSWYNQPIGGSLLGTGLTYTTPALTTTTTYYVSSCPGFARIPLVVTVDRVTGSFTSTTVCAGSPTVFSSTGTSTQSIIVSYNWDYGNSLGAGFGQNTAYSYPAGGTYAANLIISDAAGCTASITNNVTVNNAPAVSFTSTAATGCNGLTVSYTNTTTGGTSYSWNFGDGTSVSTQTSPVHTYSTPGTYTVTLTSGNGGCTATTTQSITVGPRPLASFATSGSNLCSNDSVHFTSTSIGNGSSIVSYSWDFGDGTISSSANPAHQYASAGTYSVLLTVSNSYCVDDTTLSITVVTSPLAAFSATTTSGCMPLGIQFNNTSTGTGSFVWDFGDGNGSASLNPSHTYTTAGNYTVTLIAVATSCPDTLRRTSYIQVANSPSSIFSNAASYCAGDSTIFTNISTGNGTAITGYTWSFGDGNTSTSTTPHHLYSAAGTYTVTLTANSSGCSNTSTGSVLINPQPTALFTASNLTGCMPLAVQFNNTSIGTANFFWNFGDGNTSASTSPLHSYTTAGNYTVSLIAISATCPDTLRRTSYIQVSNSPTAIFANPALYCLGDSAVFSNASNGNGSTITGYTWNFGDGNVSTQTSPHHYYSTAGTYTITLTSSNSGCSNSTTGSVVISPRPNSAFTANNLTGCMPLAVQFTNTSTGTTTFAWDFGDGSTSTSANPSHTYTVAGSYTVTLVAVSASCPDTLRRSSYIRVLNSPTSVFSSSSSYCIGDSAIFINTSTGNGSVITGYSWSFGDGNTSTSTAPHHFYSSSGTYTVTLTTSNSGCSNGATASVVINPRPTSSFSAVLTTTCAGSPINFTNSSSGATLSSWTFGDGGVSSQSSPLHSYFNSGTYTVVLVSSNGSCTDTLRRNAYVNILSTPTSSFVISPTLCLGDSAFITNASNGNGSAISSYTWSFGDGTFSSQTNPHHLYSSAGNYSILLTASNGACSDDTTISINVNATPAANFTANALQFCGPSTVTFTNLTAGAPLFTWNFGDGSSSTLPSPVHSYAASGNYTVSLIATQGSCADTLTQTNYITVTPQPRSSFSCLTAICLGDSLRFTNGSTGNGSTLSSYIWTFGDGGTASTSSPSHLYAIAGSFNATLTVSNGQCADDTTVRISVNAVPVISFLSNITTGCGSTVTSFTNNTTLGTTFLWSFGDGSTSSSSFPSHTYSSPGVYTVTLTSSFAGCSATLVKSNYITVYAQPTSIFSTTNICLGDSAHYTNASTGNGSPITSYLWDFGDAATSTAVSPLHYYSTAANYSVVLTVSNGFCSNSTTTIIAVNAPPVVAFTTPSTTVCGISSTSFTNTTSGSPSFIWNFGDGATSTATSPSHTYSAYGSYSVTLIATQGSCSDTLIQPNYVNVYPVPTASFSSFAGCLGDSSRFTNLSSGNTAVITSYSWSFGDGNTSSAASPSHLYSASGNFSVTLTAATAHCQDDSMIMVIIANPPMVNFTASSNHACDTLTVEFYNGTSGGTTYLWNFGDGNTSSAFAPTHLYAAPGTYNVLLTASSGSGCSASKLSMSLVDIKTTPIVNISASRTNICPGECIAFSDLSTGSPTRWTWTFGGASPSISGVKNPLSVCYLATGSYDVMLTASNGSCTASSTVSGMINVVDCSVLPNASFISSDTAFCTGTCINFRDLSTNATAWQWIFSGAAPSTSASQNPSNICYSTPGFYDVTLIAYNVTGRDTIKMAGLVDVSMPPVSPTFTQTGNTLVASPGSSYQWYRNGIAISGATNQQYIAMLSGNYSVEVYNSSGCSAVSAGQHVSLIGFSDPSSANISIYPNPAHDHLFFSLPFEFKSIRISLYNSLGQQILGTTNTYQSLIDVDLSGLNLSLGTYILLLDLDAKRYRKLILIN